MKPRISIITLGVADLKRATELYEDGLGLPRKEEFEDISFFLTRHTWRAFFSGIVVFK